ncbi:hypothetical protein CYMTET_32869 [Cymbomonas tetramitiformis]|uniref:Uncharacterized protein n=1 Tax=Cymbomonas tetramitiformis TaxID=36881 RepID=A0AAE0FDY4_9CHLO|nr:hypothetical protein CYMTET_32869 [Cymbomonas tetramitiformis]
MQAKDSKNVDVTSNVNPLLNILRPCDSQDYEASKKRASRQKSVVEFLFDGMMGVRRVTNSFVAQPSTNPKCRGSKFEEASC